MMKRNGLHEIFIHISEGLANALGYDDLVNMFLSIFAVRNWLVFLESVTLGVFVAFGLGLTPFIESYIYAPVFGLVMFNILIALEVSSGTWVVVKVKGQKFDLGKAIRGLIMKPVGQNLVLMVVYNMAKASDVYLWLPIAVWTAFTGINFMKWLRNLVLSDALHGDLADVILRQFSDKYQFKVNKKDDGEI